MSTKEREKEKVGSSIGKKVTVSDDCLFLPLKKEIYAVKNNFPRFNLRGSILNIDDRRHEVKYMCNKCGKLRVMFSLCDLKTEDLASKGYIEITDIHNCVESKLTPITLYVDASYSVRSQFPIELEKTKTTEPLPGLDIPLPIKVKSSLDPFP